MIQSRDEDVCPNKAYPSHHPSPPVSKDNPMILAIVDITHTFHIIMQSTLVRKATLVKINQSR
jgi:hypothetical protein